MIVLYIFLAMLFSDFNDHDKNREKSQTVVMDVIVEIVPGSLLFDQLTQSIEATSNSNNFQIGFKEFTISFPAESEVITGEVMSKGHSCNSYMVANIEKINEHTGKVKIHYLVGNRDLQKKNSASEKHTATIIYL